MGKKLYVGNLSFRVGNTDLEELFAQYGTVESVQIVEDRATGQSRGFGFVEMSSSTEAEAAVAALNSSDFAGRTLTVNEARPRAQRDGGRRDRW